MLRQRVLTAIVMLLGLYLGTAWLPAPFFAVFLGLVLLPALWEWGQLMGLRRAAEQAVWTLGFAAILLLTLFLMSRSSVPEADLDVTAQSLGTAVSSINEMALTTLMAFATLFWFWVFWTIRQYPSGQHRWQQRWKIGALGVLCLLPTWLGLYYLKMIESSGVLVFVLVALVSVVDIGAYFSGRKWGNRRLAPALSPKKSWAGFWGGLASCVALSALLLAWLHSRQPLSIDLWALLMCLAVLLAVLSVVGDLFESMLKRHRGIKDSGRSLPGHGGVLDRIDSLMAATPVFVLALILLRAMPEVL
ncbi:MAG: phosphatidate cytidylyltransferase [Pseudomonadota bacterium]|nr:phosphatidate cytidylyltransferase [Pseudomonadota bacterium]